MGFIQFRGGKEQNQLHCAKGIKYVVELNKQDQKQVL